MQSIIAVYVSVVYVYFIRRLKLSLASHHIDADFVCDHSNEFAIRWLGLQMMDCIAKHRRNGFIIATIPRHFDSMTN